MVEIDFSGARARDSPLTWAQRSTRRWIRWLGPHQTSLNIPYVLPIDGEPDLPEVLAALRLLIERHETLRTIYPETPAGPRQRVVGSGTLPVAVHDHEETPALHALAEEVASRLAGTPFRHETELPLRAAVLRVAGRPRALALAVSHLSADWAALLMLKQDWARILRTDPAVVGPITVGPAAVSSDGGGPATGGWQPADQALAEQRGPVAAAGAAALAHWRAALRRIPRSVVDFPTGTPEPLRYVRLGLHSPAAAVAATTLAERWRTSTTTVLAAATGALVGAYTGHATVAIRVITGNRREPPLRDLVGKVAQDGLLVLEPTQPTFPEIVRHCRDGLKAAYASSRCDPEIVDRFRTRTGHERGASMDLLVFFNDFRYDRSWSNLPAQPPAALTAQTRIRFDFATERAHARLFFTLEPSTESCEFFLLMDTAYVPRETGAALLRGVERLLLASLDADVPTERIAAVAGIEPVPRPAGWTRIGPDWLDLAATRELLLRAVPARHIALELPEGGGLTAYLVGEDHRSTARQVHARVMAALTGRTDVLAPGLYVLCAEPPADPDDLDQWRACPRLDEGDGRVPEAEQVHGPLPPEGP